MQLARHSDPKLTMAVYGKAQLHDLAGVVGRLPALLTDPPTTQGAGFAATGTDGNAAELITGELCEPESLRQACAAGEAGRGRLRVVEVQEGAEGQKRDRPQPADSEGVEAGCDRLRVSEGSSPTRTRTWNKPVNSRKRLGHKVFRREHFQRHKRSVCTPVCTGRSDRIFRYIAA
jgi:hypothetical protein